MKTQMFILGSIVLVVLGIAMVSLLDKTNSQSSTDVRARAAQIKSLEFRGTVVTADESQNTIMMQDFFMEDSRKEPKNLGTWTVTAPVNFDFSTALPGTELIVSVDSKTFLAQSHTVSALAIKEAK